MEQDKLDELIRIFRQLSPGNQQYLLSLAQVAAVAERAARTGPASSVPAGLSASLPKNF